MFANKKLEERIDALEKAVDRLKGDLASVQSEIEPFRIEDINPYKYLYMGYSDTREKVSVREVIDLILRHLEVKLAVTQAVPAVKTLEKVNVVKVRLGKAK